MERATCGWGENRRLFITINHCACIQHRYIGLCDTVQPNTARNFRLDGIRVAASG